MSSSTITAQTQTQTHTQSRAKSEFMSPVAMAVAPALPANGRPPAISQSASYNGNGTAPSPQRRHSNAVSPQLYDFSKTDRAPHVGNGFSSAMNGGARAVSTPGAGTGGGGVSASLPLQSHIQAMLDLARGGGDSAEDMEMDMQFGGSDDDDRARMGRSGSQDIEMDFDGEDSGEVITQALGTGSGGVKGRRKGETFDCEYCGKTYRHPSCLSKHRWEHSSHWKEPTAANMSKHQQVQTLEAAAILTLGHSLPKDKSLWPSVISSSVPGQPGFSSTGAGAGRRMSNSPFTSTPTSSLAPLTPSSLREPSSLGAMGERMGKERKSSPGSDSTTSSMGAGDPYPTSTSNGLGLRTLLSPPVHHQSLHPSLGQRRSSITRKASRTPSFSNTRPRRASRTPSFSNSPGHPNSLPDMAGLHFHSGSAPGQHSVSPIPNRGVPLSLNSRTGMIGGGMFGHAVNTSIRSSSIRSGADDLPEEDDDEDDDEEDGDDEEDYAEINGSGHGHGHGHGHREKSSSEDAEEARKGREGEEWGMAEEMEL